MRLKLGLLLIFLLTCSTNGYKILGLFSFSSKSHINGFLPLAKELVTRGHEVTLFHPHSGLKVPSSIKSTVVTELVDYMKIAANPMDRPGFFQIKGIMVQTCEKILTAKTIKELLKAGKQYDIVVIPTIMSECSLAIAPLLGKYLILFSSGPLPPFLPNPAPHPPSTVPNLLLDLPSKMNFQQRFKNFVVTVLVENAYKYILMPSTTSVIQKEVPEAPTAWEAWKKLSLIMVNQDIVTTAPRPTVPNMVEVPGINCNDAKPLPKDLEDFVQSSGDDGVIIFSLGSVAESKFLTKEVKDAFLKAFARLKQKVIWKYEDDSLKPSANVKLVKWIPQQDLLGHPKVKLFISHGGTQSLQEAVYHAVPIIGIPLYGDQPGNVARMKELDLGKGLDSNTITADEIYETITSILNDKGYSERMKKYSAIFKDVLQPPIQKGVFWIEYVARHNGARHLRTLGEDMCLIKYFLIDVIAFVTLVPLVTLYITYRVVKFGCKKLCGRKQKKLDTKKTQ